MTGDHRGLVAEQFGEQARAYVDSAVHAEGEDLRRLAAMLAAQPGGRALDVGCGGVSHMTAARHCREVVAVDLSAAMLGQVRAEAVSRGLGNIVTREASAESLPFEDGGFDWVLSRYSAHHWPRLCKAMAEARRVIRPGGVGVFMDVVAPAAPLLDTWLQTFELMRDPGHLRNRTVAQWRQALTEAGFAVDKVFEGRIRLDFQSWVRRMATPEPLVTAIRLLQAKMPAEVAEHFALEPDGSFQLDVATLVVKAV